LSFISSEIVQGAIAASSSPAPSNGDTDQSLLQDFGSAFFDGVAIPVQDFSDQLLSAFVDASAAAKHYDYNGTASTIFAAISLAISLFLWACTFWFREEPEIRSRHLPYLCQFAVGSILFPLFSIPFAQVSFLQVDVSYQSKEFSNLFLALSCLLLFSNSLIITSMIARQRFMWLVFVRREARPNYWGMFWWYALTILSAMFPEIYFSETTNVLSSDVKLWKSLIGSMVVYPLYMGEWLFYTLQLHGASPFFVDIGINVRFFCLALPVTYVFYVTALVMNATEFVLLVHLWITNAIVLAYTIDALGLLVLKVVLRQLGWKSFLDMIDLKGDVYDPEDLRRVEALISDRELSVLLQKYAGTQLCEENVNFLLAIRAFCSMDFKSPEALATARTLYQDYVRVDAPYELNLTDVVRRALDSTFASEKVAATPTMFGAAEKEIKKLTQQLLKEFMVLPDVTALLKRRAKNAEQRRILAESGLILLNYDTSNVSETETYLSMQSMEQK